MRWSGAIFDGARQPHLQSIALEINYPSSNVDWENASEELARALEAKWSDPDFAQTPERVRRISQQEKKLKDLAEKADKLRRLQADLDAYLQLIREESDAIQKQQVLTEAAGELDSAEKFVAELETETLLSGETDHLNAIMTIKPGAGGTESQDWASILLRMYLRWAERKGMSAEVLDETPGEEAGLKSATIQFSGENAYGLLAGETGVHRLVRISPFDQAARRHTSFASVFVIPEIDDRIEINIRPEDLRVDTFRSGGKGGQNVNKVETAVRITHLPTNIVVACQAQRSQGKNREMAMKMLRSRLYDEEIKKRQAHTDKLDESKLDISFGSQIRSYIMQPYRLIKDHRTRFEVGDVDRVMDGDLDPFIRSYLMAKKTKGKLDIEPDDDAA